MNPSAPQQAAVIAIRHSGGIVQVCLIRKKASNSWGIPKGMVDPGDTPEETALNEAWEEAGLRGRLLGECLGTYEYEKWQATLVVVVYVMDVRAQYGEWQEAGVRERRWVPFGEAAALLVDHPVRSMLDRARRIVEKAASSRRRES